MKDFLAGFLGMLVCIIIAIVIIAPLVILCYGGSAWWLVAFIVELCVFSGILNAIK